MIQFMGKAWRPNETQLSQLETMAGYGMKEAQMAAILGVSLSTFQRAEKKCAALGECLLKGRAIASSNVLATAYEMATSKNHPAMTIFWLKVREHWKDTTVIEHTEKTVKQSQDVEATKKRIAAKVKKLRLLEEQDE